jgi:hypothetical protein
LPPSFYLLPSFRYIYFVQIIFNWRNKFRYSNCSIYILQINGAAIGDTEEEGDPYWWNLNPEAQQIFTATGWDKKNAQAPAAQAAPQPPPAAEVLPLQHSEVQQH